ncbi:hypothetical protein OBV_13160 [Oscillibacter valericigenes Sjm18-20]|nr:hypothetical protein OBV_13160 [Oscillibacter valericigenes Sjm18-20]
MRRLTRGKIEEMNFPGAVSFASGKLFAYGVHREGLKRKKQRKGRRYKAGRWQT